MAFSFSTAEDALVAWVTAALVGVTGAKVVLADQNQPRPGVPYALLRLSPLQKVGSLDTVETAYDAGAPPGEEITITTSGPRMLAVQVQTFAALTTGDLSALALMNRVLLQLELGSQTDAFETAGLAVGPVGTPQNVSALVETATQSRAALDVQFHCTDAAEETTTYIQTVTTTGTVAS